jgi:hypothetical protein
MDKQVTIEIDDELARDICRLVQARSPNPMEGLVALVGSIWLLKAMYLETMSDERLATIVGEFMRSLPKIVRVQDPTHPLN